MLSIVADYGSADCEVHLVASHQIHLFLENQELVALPFIRLANRQSSIVECGVCGIFGVICGVATTVRILLSSPWTKDHLMGFATDIARVRTRGLTTQNRRILSPGIKVLRGFSTSLLTANDLFLAISSPYFRRIFDEFLTNFLLLSRHIFLLPVSWCLSQVMTARAIMPQACSVAHHLLCMHLRSYMPPYMPRQEYRNASKGALNLYYKYAAVRPASCRELRRFYPLNIAGQLSPA
jgi:hypothetical protein